MAARVAILGHTRGNIGHSLMAAGVESLLDGLVPPPEVATIEQHEPFDVYRSGSPARLLNVLSQGPGGIKPALARTPALRRLLEYRDSGPARSAKRALSQGAAGRVLWKYAGVRRFEYVIACGGPNITPVSGREGDAGLVQLHMPGAFTANGIPVAFLAVGSCFPVERPPEPAGETVRSFVRNAALRSTVVTVRDALARRLFTEVGADVRLIPCTALLSMGDTSGSPDDGYILVNYQRRGANTDWGQGVDVEAWRRSLGDVVRRLAREHRVAFLCHDPGEVALAGELAGHLPRFAPGSVDEYRRVVAQAKVAVVSRLHAAIPLAGAGVPSVVVGTDTRLQAAETIGLPTMFVKEATAGALAEAVDDLLARREAERDRLRALVRDTRAQYRAVLDELRA